MDAFGLPKKTDEEKAIRKKAIDDATKNAIMVPFRVMEIAHQSLEVVKAMAEIGNPNSVSDAGVGALAIRSCVKGAFLNVKINAAGLDDKDFMLNVNKKATKIENETERLEKEILKIVESKISHKIQV
jgi:glutamate formiminotransferase/formiminotetrahydrofolate cyclodeaminase